MGDQDYVSAGLAFFDIHGSAVGVRTVGCSYVVMWDITAVEQNENCSPGFECVDIAIFPKMQLTTVEGDEVPLQQLVHEFPRVLGHHGYTPDPVRFKATYLRKLGYPKTLELELRSLTLNAEGQGIPAGNYIDAINTYRVQVTTQTRSSEAHLYWRHK